MDRKTIYDGQVPFAADLLTAQQNTMVALARFCQSVFGSSVLVSDFTVVPTTPATLNVTLTPGAIYQLGNLEATAWSSLPANIGTSILKQGIQFINNGAALGVGIAATLGITPPTTTGYSQVFLVEVQYQDMDGGALVLPYYNAANPQDSFAGPGNAGTAQDTVRYGGVAYQVKAGVAAPTGNQVAPTQDAGWTGLFYVTVANGAASITSGNITPYPNAPFLAADGYLPQVPTGVQNSTWCYGADTGSVNALVASVEPAPQALTPGLRVLVKIANTNTGASTLNLNGLGAVAIHRANGAVLSSGDINAGMVLDLVYDGAAFQIVNFEGFTSSTTNNNTFTVQTPYGTDTGAVNAVVASVSSGGFSPSALSAGLIVEVLIANTNTGASTLNINGLGVKSIVTTGGNPLTASQLVSGAVALLLYGGAVWQLINPAVLVLQANKNWYVNASIGSDTVYDGTSPTVSGAHGPFATIQKAVATTLLFDMNGFGQTINVADGSYVGQITLPTPNGSGTISIIGNEANPQNCSVFSSGGQQSCFFQTGGAYYISGFRVSTDAGGWDGLTAQGNQSSMQIGNIHFGSVAHSHIAAIAGANILLVSGKTITIETSANCLYHMECSQGLIQVSNPPGAPGYPNLTISGAVTMTAFISATFLGVVQVVYNGLTGAGNVTGQKYNGSLNAVVSSLNSGTGYYPGTSAGSLATGAQYD